MAQAKDDEENVEIANEAARESDRRYAGRRRVHVKSVSNNEKRRNPVPPFITSTLQQEGGAQAAVQREANDDAGAEAV